MQGGLVIASFLITTSSCAQKSKINYLALGDSYTIEESVTEEQRWPVQLVNVLNKKDLNVADPKIITRTGWTTDELQEAIAEQNPSSV